MMRLLRCGVPLLVLAAGLALVSESASAQGEKKGALVSLDGLSSRAPADWKEVEGARQFRYKEFSLPRQGDDKADAELEYLVGCIIEGSEPAIATLDQARDVLEIAPASCQSLETGWVIALRAVVDV